MNDMYYICTLYISHIQLYSLYVFLPGNCYYAIEKIIDKLERTFTELLIISTILQFYKFYFELFNYRAEPTL